MFVPQKLHDRKEKVRQILQVQYWANTLNKNHQSTVYRINDSVLRFASSDSIIIISVISLTCQNVATSAAGSFTDVA